MARNHTSLVTSIKGTPELRFLITDRPTNDPTALAEYVKVLKENKVTNLVRVCEPSYDTTLITNANIAVKDMPFDDGEPPPEHVIDEWLTLADSVFKNNGTIAVHCVAGLGRAPVMVALSLIERGMSPEDAVLHIREQRRGAINSKQLLFLRNYRRRTSGGGKCVIM